MCCVSFLVKYVLFFTNVVFSLAGIALIALGIVVLVQITEILELIPVNLNLIPISVIVLGSVIFLIAFFGCCGAIRESRCLLIMYSVSMLILAAAKIWLTVIIFQGLSTIYDTVEGWIRDAFDNPNLREPFHLVEVAIEAYESAWLFILFRCCGVNGPDSYIGVYPAIPPTCCANPTSSDNTGTCAREDSFGGCANIVADYFEIFGDVIGVILITIIIVELVAMIFGLYLSNSITNKNKRGYA